MHRGVTGVRGRSWVPAHGPDSCSPPAQPRGGEEPRRVPALGTPGASVLGPQNNGTGAPRGLGTEDRRSPARPRVSLGSPPPVRGQRSRSPGLCCQQDGHWVEPASRKRSHCSFKPTRLFRAPAPLRPRGRAGKEDPARLPHQRGKTRAGGSSRRSRLCQPWNCCVTLSKLLALSGPQCPDTS